MFHYFDINETSLKVLNIFIIRLTSLWVSIVFLSTSVFFESAHICKDLQKICRSAHICKDLQKSCRSAHIRKDRKPGYFRTCGLLLHALEVMVFLEIFFDGCISEEKRELFYIIEKMKGNFYKITFTIEIPVPNGTVWPL